MVLLAISTTKIIILGICPRIIAAKSTKEDKPMNYDIDSHIVIPFETRIIIQDREGYTDRLDNIKSIIGYSFDRNDNFTAIQCEHSDPVFGAWFGYDTKPGSNIDVLMRFPKTVLELTLIHI